MPTSSFRRVARLSVVALPLVGLVAMSLAAVAACSDDPEATPDPEPVEAGEAAAPDTSVADSGPSKRDCKTDLDGDGLSRHLECAGLYQDLATKAVAADLRPYKPAAEFWSDGAQKQRWIYLPPGAKIAIGGDGGFDEWSFPPGTKLFKEFAIGGKRIETRLFEKSPEGSWRHTTYRWTADETDAVRNDVGEKLAGLGPDGGIYEVPNTGQCNDCHDGRKEPVLGFDAVSLGLPGATGLTLSALATEGRFSDAPPLTELALPNDATNLAPPALAWLHANCGACHNGNPTAGASFRAHYLVRASQLVADASVETLDPYTNAYCVDSNRFDPDAGTPFKLIRGGLPADSLIAVLAGQRVAAGEVPLGSVQMPPLVTRAPDTAGLAAVKAWIAALPPCP